MNRIFASAITYLIAKNFFRKETFFKWISGVKFGVYMATSKTYPSFLALLCDKYGTDKGEVVSNGLLVARSNFASSSKMA